MALTKGRVVRQGEAEARPIARAEAVAPERRERVLRAEMEATAAAARIMNEAQAKASAMLEAAKQQAADAVAIASKEAEEREQSKLAASYLALVAREEQRAERDLERAVGLAVVLAERLVGASLATNPAQITGLARQALAEARGTRRAKIEAHPLDAEALLTHIAQIAPPEIVVSVTPNAELPRGSLLLHTDLGTLDAKLAPRLERLAAALRGALR